MTALLELSGVAKAFRGIKAVRDASFTVEAGSITGVIGPNGSGKSTTIDCLSGFQRPDAGTIRLAGEDITGLAPAAIARRGLIRTFQAVRVYETYNLLDNLLVVEAPFRGLGWFDALARTRAFRDRRVAAEARARSLIESVGLTRMIEMPASVLSYGQKKVLAFTAAMMASPKIIVLDEPVAGVNPSRINEVAEILRSANRTGVTFLIVEHNVEFINDLCDKVVVLDQGVKLTEGTAEQIHCDARVLDAYLGLAPGENRAAMVAT
jgi:ABC-type branched-subunit amino acid transport system ATPase component